MSGKPGKGKKSSTPKLSTRSQVLATETQKAMELDYCTAQTKSLKETAEKHGVSEDYANQLSVRFGWKEKRNAFLTKVEQEAESTLARRLARERRNSIRAHLRRAQTLDALGSAVLESTDANKLGPGFAMEAIKLASELERKVLKLDEHQSAVQVQVAVVPLLANTESERFTAMVKQLGGKSGTEQS